jgi:hypothetical protein
MITPPPIMLCRRFLACLWVFLSVSIESVTGTPAPLQYFCHQLVDHTNKAQYSKLYWTQRYYESGAYFNGPGSPILLILGGEGAIPPETGLFYPFMTDRLAKTFGAFVLEPEHR